MSAKDLETIREGIAALNRGDVEGLAATLDPDVELIPLKAVLDGTVYRGHEGMRRWLQDMDEDWTRFEIQLQETRELGADRVLVEATMRLRGQSGVALDSTAAWLCDMRAGKVARLRFFTDADAALKATEAAEPA
jgi:ketosteroid isomerase-like protein